MKALKGLTAREALTLAENARRDERLNPRDEAALTRIFASIERAARAGQTRAVEELEVSSRVKKELETKGYTVNTWGQAPLGPCVGVEW